PGLWLQARTVALLLRKPRSLYTSGGCLSAVERRNRPMSPTKSDAGSEVLAGGRYRIVSKLGEGGMGLVFRAWDNQVERDVVIKVPKAHLLDEESRQRFVREIRSLVHLEHPHILPVLDIGEHHGVPFLVVKYLSGGSLAARLRGSEGQRRQLQLAELEQWLRQ